MELIGTGRSYRTTMYINMMDVSLNAGAEEKQRFWLACLIVIWTPQMRLMKNLTQYCSPATIIDELGHTFEAPWIDVSVFVIRVRLDSPQQLTLPEAAAIETPEHI
ncbi:hypothetical protein NPIL_245241 [Nephila pilipes]|uniref:Uncharacterized protein n=1 Tax=Nephila pilipes TaxID=299642 RepID=A0A8X6TP53_NEPPI|nr:hypothetical protein NPIL_245241 [Nephila pilipes]